MEDTIIQILGEMVKLLGPNLVFLVGIFYVYAKYIRQKKSNGGNGGLVQMILDRAGELQNNSSHQDFFEKRCKPEFETTKKYMDKQIDTLVLNQYKVVTALAKLHPELTFLDDPRFELRVKDSL